jgi:alpha-ribazole phosphatase/probable phosphoglycerate mutase
MTTRFWLIRHGETEEWTRGRCYGSLDVGLSPNGRLQIARVAQTLKREPIAVVFSSPLHRALESACAIATECSCPCEVLPALREIDFGDFEGIPYDEIAARYPAEYRCWMQEPAKVAFPNGESFSLLRARVLDAFMGIAEQRAGQTVAIVSHGGAIRALIAWALQIPDDCVFRVAQEAGAINLLVLTEGTPSVQLLNASGVLES